MSNNEDKETGLVQPLLCGPFLFGGIIIAPPISAAETALEEEDSSGGRGCPQCQYFSSDFINGEMEGDIPRT